MRWLLTGPVLLASLAGVPPPIAQNATPLQNLLTDREYRDYQARPKYTARMDLFRKVLERRSATVAQLLARDKTTQASALLVEIQELSRYVLNETTRAKSGKDRRSKQVKKLEISLRKLVERLRDLQSTVSFEYASGFQQTVDELEVLRKALLRQILGQRGATRVTPQSMGGNPSRMVLAALIGSLRAVPVQGPLPSRDRFTEEEFTAIQTNQELVKRVEVFLEIASSRLDEISRRMQKREWTEEESNPLEFFTYKDMVHAYSRAIDSAMINIDEKAIHEQASEDDLQRSLKAIYEGMKMFRPQLEAIQALATDLKDEALYRKVMEAQETSSVAYQGALFGLGISDQ